MKIKNVQAKKNLIEKSNCVSKPLGKMKYADCHRTKNKKIQDVLDVSRRIRTSDLEML